MDKSISWYTLKHFWKKPIFIDLILIPLFVGCLVIAISVIKRPAHFDVSGLCINLSTSFLGTWIAVRIVDNMMRKREKLKTARQTFVSEITHPVEFLKNTLPVFTQRDYTRLEKEIHWFNRKWPLKLTGTIFKPAEEEIAREITGLNLQLLGHLQHLITVHRMTFNAESERGVMYNERLAQVDAFVAIIDTQLERLILEVWKTDSPVTL